MALQSAEVSIVERYHSGKVDDVWLLIWNLLACSSLSAFPFNMDNFSS